MPPEFYFAGGARHAPTFSLSGKEKVAKETTPNSVTRRSDALAGL